MSSKRYLMWPVKLRWIKPLPHQKPSWFKKHGWHVGYDGFEQHVYGWTFHLGRLKVRFGDVNFKRRNKR